MAGTNETGAQHGPRHGDYCLVIEAAGDTVPDVDMVGIAQPVMPEAACRERGSRGKGYGSAAASCESRQMSGSMKARQAARNCRGVYTHAVLNKVPMNEGHGEGRGGIERDQRGNFDWHQGLVPFCGPSRLTRE